MPHGLGAVDQTNTVTYLGRIEAIGDSIKVWYLKLDDVKDPDGDLGDPILEFKTQPTNLAPSASGMKARAAA